MNELQLDTDEQWATIFHQVLRKERKPLTRRKFKLALRKYKIKVNDNNLGVILHYLTDKGVLIQVKYPKFHSFYSLPEWVEDGKFKDKLQFDIIYGRFNKKPKI